MPVVRVEMLSGRSQQQKNEIAEVFTKELARIAGCGIKDVQIVFSEVERGNWAVGGVISTPHAAASKAS
ncbi:tautomerase family protein (plasmid) [Rhizobium sp. CB3171]|uniref:tautomerase family protein n=1 Tax=unclassified Rhizobium TaxID=2613769 RepID=UPI000CDF4A4B|nr:MULTISPECIES: tautomerase family protein [Rhizobium]AVA24605.1 4-oxalocrotonate tautomerase protein [Rhizobium sp. NXC24]UWU24521.1 tautomerase family protein [Rhizobium tropici]WFU05496.1 tautomerase family protein [Rhizobium sp. CB3171]